MRIQVLMLSVGDILIQDAFTPKGLNVLSAGTLLEADDIYMLNQHNVDYVDVADRLHHTQFVNANNPKILEQERAFSQAVDGIKSLFESVEIEGLLHDADVQASLDPLMESFNEENDVVSLLLTLNSNDDYTFQHSVQVGMLSYYLAKWLGKSEQESLLIGKAGYLHDIGKSKIDQSILNKPGRLTADEFDEIKKHTIYGYDIIRHSYKDTGLALAALQHHERIEGNGYPLRKKGKDIHPFARIVAVADVYSAMTSNRAYQKKKDLLYVLRELHRMSFGELDAEATQCFIKHMIPNFIGKKVNLTDGRVGDIILTNPSDFFRPLIQIDSQFFDLSHEAEIEIDSITM